MDATFDRRQLLRGVGIGTAGASLTAWFPAWAQTVSPGLTAPLATVAADKDEVKVTVDVPSNLPPGPHSVVLRGQSAAPPPKQPNNAIVRPTPQYPAAPITVVVEGKEPPKKK